MADKPNQNPLLKNPEFLRRQTLFWLLAAICFGLSLLLPIATASPSLTLTGLGADDASFRAATGLVFSPVLWGLMISLGLVASIWPMFQFRNRKRQLAAANRALVIVAVIVLTLAALVYLLGIAAAEMETAAGTSLGPGLATLLLPLPFHVMAYFATRNDYKKIRSSERFW